MYICLTSTIQQKIQIKNPYFECCSISKCQKTNWKWELTSWVLTKALQEILKTTQTKQNTRWKETHSWSLGLFYIGLVDSVWVIWRRHFSLCLTGALQSCIPKKCLVFLTDLSSCPAPTLSIDFCLHHFTESSWRCKCCFILTACLAGCPMIPRQCMKRRLKDWVERLI